MPLPTAEPILGKTSWGGGPPELEELPRGWSGTRWFKIEGRDVAEASRAIGLPRMNELWPGFRDLKVVARRLRVMGGKFDTAAQYGGWTSAEIRYATPDGGGSAPVPELNRAFSQWQGAQESITRNFDARVNLPPGYTVVEPPGGPFPTPITPVNNGKGVQVAVGTARLLVSKWVRGADIDLPRLLRLHSAQAVNSDNVTAPPALNDTRSWSFSRGELRYLEFAVEPDGEVMKITHVLGAAPDHLYRWQPEDENGDAVGPLEVSVVYPALPFGGLW